MNNGQVRYGNSYSPYPYQNNPYGTPEHNASTTSVSSLASTSSKIMNLFKSDKKSKNKRRKDSEMEGPPVPEKDYPPGTQFPYANGRNALPSSSSLSLSVSDASGHSASGSLGQRNGPEGQAGGSSNLFKIGKGRKKKEKQAENISTPWNVKHETHVDDGLSGFPPEWQASLLQLGYSPAEIKSMIEQKRRQPAHSNLIPIGPNATIPASTTSLNISLLQNQSISLTALQSEGNLGGGSGGVRYPSPPQQFALPNLPAQQPFNLSLQTELGRRQNSNSANSSPVTYAPRPAPVPHQIRNIPDRTGSPSQVQRTGSPAGQLRNVNVPDRTNSPASSTRSHPQHQVSLSLSGSEARASPVPSLRKDGSGLGASGLSNSPISHSPVSSMDSQRLLRDVANVPITTTIAMGIGSNTMSSATSPGSKPVVSSAAAPTKVSPVSTTQKTPARPPPPPPLFGIGAPVGISTGKANAYKPPTAIAVQDDDDEDEVPLGNIKAKAANETKLVVINGAAECLSPASATPTSQSIMQNATTSTNAASVPTAAPSTAPSVAQTVSRAVLTAAAPPTMSTTGPTPDKTETSKDSTSTTPTTALSFEAPPRLSLGIPRISLELGKLDLDLGSSLGSTLGLGSSEDRQSVEWSESLFSALPSATAFGSFRSSVILPNSNSPKVSPGLSPSPTPRTGTTIVGGNGSASGSPIGSAGRVSPAEARVRSPTSVNSSPGISPISPAKDPNRPSPVAPTPPMSAFANARPQVIRRDTTESTDHIRQIVSQSSDEGDPADRRSVMSHDSIASSNLLGHDMISSHDIKANERYRESVSTDSSSRQSVSSFGAEDDDEGLGETVVVARATAVKLARAPSVALRNNFDAFAIGRQQGGLGVASSANSRQYSPMTGGYYNGFDGFDEEDEEEDSDEDEDSDEEEDEEEEDPNSRLTIRLDDINANRLMDAVMRNKGELDHATPDDGNTTSRPLSTSTLRTKRPISTSTVSTSRPISSSTVRLGPPMDEKAEADEHANVLEDEEDSSALDDWLEANEADEHENIVEEKSDRSEYDDADYPLSAITASETPLPHQQKMEAREQSPDSDYSPAGEHTGSNGRASEEGNRSATPVAEDPDRIRGAKHGRGGSTAGSGSGPSLVSHRSQRSSVIYAPQPTLSPQLLQVLRPVLSFIRSGDPTIIYSELQQVAEGESGGIYAASPSGRAGSVVAIKRVKVHEETVARIETLGHELTLLRGLNYLNVLTYTAVWLVGDLNSGLDGSAELWIRMDLMERSLADLLSLLEGGLVIEERHVARFAKDTAAALAFLESRLIAHRDVRSDNLLVSSDGIVKLADFATAVQVSKDNTMCNDNAGIIYWQAPEIRRGTYDAMKVDVWSLGATVWELIEGETPFESDPDGPSDRLPEITHTDAQQVSQGLLGFLNLCESSAQRRPSARSLLDTPFIRAACPRDEVLRLLSQALDIERAISSS